MKTVCCLIRNIIIILILLRFRHQNRPQSEYRFFFCSPSLIRTLDSKHYYETWRVVAKHWLFNRLWLTEFPWFSYENLIKRTQHLHSEQPLFCGYREKKFLIWGSVNSNTQRPTVSSRCTHLWAKADKHTKQRTQQPARHSTVVSLLICLAER